MGDSNLDVSGSAGNIGIQYNIALQDVSTPVLQTVLGEFSLGGSNNLTAVNLGSLNAVSGDLVLSSNKGILD